MKNTSLDTSPDCDHTKTFITLSDEYSSMSTDVRSVDERSVDEREVVSAVDEADGTARFVVADIARDEAWLSTPECDAASLDEWR